MDPVFFDGVCDIAKLPNDVECTTLKPSHPFVIDLMLSYIAHELIHPFMFRQHLEMEIFLWNNGKNAERSLIIFLWCCPLFFLTALYTWLKCCKTKLAISANGWQCIAKHFPYTIAYFNVSSTVYNVIAPNSYNVHNAHRFTRTTGQRFFY